jgi:hypothetical protein
MPPIAFPILEGNRRQAFLCIERSKTRALKKDD